MQEVQLTVPKPQLGTSEKNGLNRMLDSPIVKRDRMRFCIYRNKEKKKECELVQHNERQ